MACEKKGLASTQNAMLNTYYSSLVSVYNKNEDPLEKIIDFPKYAPTNCMVDFIARYELVKLIKDIPGDIFELGVCGGRGIFSFFHK